VLESPWAATTARARHLGGRPAITLGGDDPRPADLYGREVSSMSARPDAASRPRGWDVVLAAGLLALAEATVFLKASRPGPVAFYAVASAVAIVPLVWRRRAPVLVWAISGCATFVAMASHGSPGPLAVGALIALYTVATISPRRVSLVSGAITLVGVTFGVLAAGRTEALGWEPFILPAVLVTSCWLIGDNLRVRRAYVAELEAKAAHAEADRAAERAHAISQERTRIARELHDVAVHHVSLIAVQAGAARVLAEEAGARNDERESLAAIEETARQALAELRQLLGVLRHDTEPKALAPAPGLRQLDELLDEVRRSGLPVTLTVDGTPATLPPAIDLSAYRIVQEALTNVVKHEGAVPTRVVVRHRASDIEIEVTNDGTTRNHTPTAEGQGHGIVGMRERVALFGGQLDAHHRPDGGFPIVARIPLGTATA